MEVIGNGIGSMGHREWGGRGGGMCASTGPKHFGGDEALSSQKHTDSGDPAWAWPSPGKNRSPPMIGRRKDIRRLQGNHEPLEGSTFTRKLKFSPRPLLKAEWTGTFGDSWGTFWISPSLKGPRIPLQPHSPPKKDPTEERPG